MYPLWIVGTPRQRVTCGDYHRIWCEPGPASRKVLQARLQKAISAVPPHDPPQWLVDELQSSSKSTASKYPLHVLAVALVEAARTHDILDATTLEDDIWLDYYSASRGSVLAYTIVAAVALRTPQPVCHSAWRDAPGSVAFSITQACGERLWQSGVAHFDSDVRVRDVIGWLFQIQREQQHTQAASRQT